MDCGVCGGVLTLPFTIPPPSHHTMAHFYECTQAKTTTRGTAYICYLPFVGTGKLVAYGHSNSRWWSQTKAHKGTLPLPAYTADATHNHWPIAKFELEIQATTRAIEAQKRKKCIYQIGMFGTAPFATQRGAHLPEPNCAMSHYPPASTINAM